MNKREAMQAAQDAIAEAKLLQTMVSDMRRAVARHEQSWRDAILSLVIPHEEDARWLQEMTDRIERMQTGLDVLDDRQRLLATHLDDANRRLRESSPAPGIVP